MTDKINQVWDKVRIIDSAQGNVWKYVFEKSDAVAEAVLYRYPTFTERTVICCSTQSGCPVGCRFCGAGDAFVRSLKAVEIVNQPVRLLADIILSDGTLPSEIQRLQIMFMSMGEPLLNLEELSKAIEDLHFLYPQASLLISTIGPRINYDKVRHLSVRVPKVGLQFSIHESTDEARDKLIPLKGKLTLKEIAEEGEEWALATGRRPFFNYCAHDKNSSAADADRLAELFSPTIWEATISVICERDEQVAAANERQRSLASNFQTLLQERGFSTRMFDPAGQDDIGGGCGQLWFVQDWMKNHPELAKPSVGKGLPIIHTPTLSCSCK